MAKPLDEAMSVCLEVASAAHYSAVPPEIAVALAFTESRMDRDAVSSRGARGPLQVLPRYYCPRGRVKGCDLVPVGIDALERNLLRYGGDPVDWHATLCHWNSGHTCYRRSRLFATIVLDRADEFRHAALLRAGDR